MSEQTHDNFGISINLLQFAEVKEPKYREKKGEGNGYIEFGTDGSSDPVAFPKYLLWLLKNSPTHGAIVRGKADYVAGNGWQIKDNVADANAEAFIKRVNGKESLADLSKKIAFDLETFYGFYLQIIWSRYGGRIAEIRHVPYLTLLSNEDNTQFWYCKDWEKGSRKKKRVLSAFNPNVRSGSQILYYKGYSPEKSTYAMPEYLNAQVAIEADVKVDKHIHNNAESGFMPSTAITLFGDPGEPKKKEIENKIIKKFTGTDSNKIVVNWGTDPAQKPVIEKLGASDLTQEDYTAIYKLIEGKIFIGHRVTSPMLFGVRVEGQLGGRNEMLDAYEIFKNTYVNAKHRIIEGLFNDLAKYNGVIAPLQIIPLEPLSFGLSEDKIAGVMTPDEIRAKAGLQPTEKKQQTQAEITNERINSLSPLVANKVLEKLTANEVRGLAGLPPVPGGDTLDTSAEQAPQQFSNQATDLSFMDEYGVASDGYVPLRTRSVQFASDEDMHFDEDHKGPIAIKLAAESLSKLELNILDLISKDGLLTVDVLAETLKVNAKVVTRALRNLETRELLKTAIDENSTVTRELTKPIEEITSAEPVTTEMQIMYRYAGPKDSKNRPWCAKLLELDRMYTRKDIESMSSRLGYSVFDRRGGWYTEPGTNNHRPYCRHTWESVVVVKND